MYFWNYLIGMFHIDIYFKRGDHGFEPRLGKTKDYKIAKLVLKRGAFLWSNYLTTSIETKAAIHSPFKYGYPVIIIIKFRNRNQYKIAIICTSHPRTKTQNRKDKILWQVICIGGWRYKPQEDAIKKTRQTGTSRNI